MSLALDLEEITIDYKKISDVFDEYGKLPDPISAYRGIFLKETDIRKDELQSQSWSTLFEAAQKGLIGYFYCLQIKDQAPGEFNKLTESNFETNYFFFEKNNPYFTPVPYLVSLDIKKINLEFGKVINPYDAIDLEKSGIKTSSNKTLAELNNTICFIMSWITKSTQRYAVKKTFASMCKGGIITSIPLVVADSWVLYEKNQHQKHYRIQNLSVLYKDFICPRCDVHFRIIEPESIGTTCPSCKTLFNCGETKSRVHNISNLARNMEFTF